MSKFQIASLCLVFLGLLVLSASSQSLFGTLWSSNTSEPIRLCEIESTYPNQIRRCNEVPPANYSVPSHVQSMTVSAKRNKIFLAIYNRIKKERFDFIYFIDIDSMAATRMIPVNVRVHDVFYSAESDSLIIDAGADAAVNRSFYEMDLLTGNLRQAFTFQGENEIVSSMYSPVLNRFYTGALVPSHACWYEVVDSSSFSLAETITADCGHFTPGGYSTSFLARPTAQLSPVLGSVVGVPPNKPHAVFVLDSDTGNFNPLVDLTEYLPSKEFPVKQFASSLLSKDASDIYYLEYLSGNSTMMFRIELFADKSSHVGVFGGDAGFQFGLLASSA